MPRGAIDWPAAAWRLAQAFPRERLHPRVMAWAEAAAHRKKTWAVAFSGGADSLCLLLLVWAYWPAQRRKLRALHFDHRLRGKASAGDAKFCAEVCRGLGVKLKRGAWTHRPEKVSEAGARAARMAFFERALARAGAAAIWFGHQQDDVAETLLMRLARGSGTAGLAAPRAVQMMREGREHVRPLLTLKKAEVVAALTAARLPWREDATNSTDEFLRNRVRRDVLPRWREATAGRDAVAGAALSRELLEEDDVALEAWVDKLGLLTPAGTLRVGRLAGVPRAIRRRALWRWLARHKLEGLSRQAVEALLAAVERGTATRHSVGSGVFAVMRGNRLTLERERVWPKKK